MADRPSKHLSEAERADLIRAFEARDPSPFRKHLTDALSVEPDWAELAKKSPDRWAQSVMIMSKLGGVHTDKLEIEGSGLISFARSIERMSDAEVEAEHQKRLKPPAKVIDITPDAAQPRDNERAEGARP